MRNSLLVSVALCLLAAMWLTAQQPSVLQAQAALAIRNARIVTVSGPVLTRGTVVLRDGVIEAVGDNVAIPADASVVEGEGLTVYPGLIDALSGWGMPALLAAPQPGGRGGAPPQPAPGTPPAPSAMGPEDRPATTSWLKAADEVQPNDRRLEQVRGAGFTTAAVFPMRGIFAGQGSLINLAGRKPEMILDPALGQYITMSPSGNGFPMALFGTISYVRQLYLDAAHYKLLQGAKTKPAYDRALEGVLESKRVLLPANRDVEIERMLRLAAELKQPAVLYGMREGYRAVDRLKRAGATVLVSLKWPEKARDADPEEDETLRALEVRDKAPSTPAALAIAGVKFALYSDTLEQPRELRVAVKKAIDAGLSREDAVRALTLSPAEIYGVADRLGSIDKGKVANLIVTRGDLFEDATRIEMVFIEGKRFAPAPEPPAPAGAKPTQGGRP
jgi:hypothetical protein